MQERVEPAVMRCPTFGSDRCVFAAHGNSPRSIPAVHFDSPKTISAAAPRPLEPSRRDDDGCEEECEDDEDECEFEFALVLTDPENGEEKTAADEIFSDGRIRTLYPADGRAHGEPVRRMSGKDQQRVSSLDSASSSSEVDELEWVAPGTYCAWEPRKPKAPPQGRCKKSSSTGSLRRWRIRDLVKRRSQSDGKEKFVFLSAEQKRGCSPRNPRRDSAEAGAIKEDDSGEEGGKPRRRGEWDMVTGHRVYSGKGSRQAAKRGARRPFLPYKQNVVGFFAIANGLGRSCHPFSL